MSDLAENHRQLGSPEDFEHEWLEALSVNDSRYLIYPSDNPLKQFDLFEQVKAQHVITVLTQHGHNSGRVLEFGCGAAGMSIYLANRGFDAIACDLSRSALRVAQLNAGRHLSNSAIHPVTYVAGNVFQLPFPNGAFDVVMSYGLLEHFSPGTLQAVLPEITRILRPGGLFISDIAHGRFSVRTLGIFASLIGSMMAHLLSFRWQRLPGLPTAYLNHYYENNLDSAGWTRALEHSGLVNVEVRVQQPFPPLALAGPLERAYVRLLRSMEFFWNWFDYSQPRWGAHWGWLYLASGNKP